VADARPARLRQAVAAEKLADPAPDVQARGDWRSAVPASAEELCKPDGAPSAARSFAGLADAEAQASREKQDVARKVVVQSVEAHSPAEAARLLAEQLEALRQPEAVLEQAVQEQLLVERLAESRLAAEQRWPEAPEWAAWVPPAEAPQA
jgi:hypothetical protein